MPYFRWILDYIDVLYPFYTFCISKKWFLSPKRENFENFKIFNQAHIWGSSALIILPHVLGDVCEQRRHPDNDFEYWMASVPRRGAEIWAAKVFRRKTKKSRKCIFNNLSSSWCIYMHQNGAQRHQLISYENIYHCGSFWGYSLWNNSFWAQN